MVRWPYRPGKFSFFFVLMVAGCVLLSGFALAAGEQAHVLPIPKTLSPARINRKKPVACLECTHLEKRLPNW